MPSTAIPSPRRIRRAKTRELAPFLYTAGRINRGKRSPRTAKLPTESDVLRWIEELMLRRECAGR